MDGLSQEDHELEKTFTGGEEMHPTTQTNHKGKIDL